MDRDIDTIIAAVRAKLPAIEVEQHQVKFPGADDDGVWWFRLPSVKDVVQIDSSDGQCPFLVDDSDSDPPAAEWISDKDEVARRIVGYFESKPIAPLSS
jgi:hypothetical protein